MSKKNESLKTVIVAGVLCVVCSIFVSYTVVTLRPLQAKNAALDVKKNILMSAGLIKAGATESDINTAFATIETVLVDMETGQKVETKAAGFNQVSASKDPSLSIKIPTADDVASLNRRSKLAKVFIKRTADGAIETVILNMWSKGLWSTMLGFIALAPDANTIKGFAYYSHGETPGLGGEVDSPNWKASWIGKKLFSDSGEVMMKVVKGTGKGNHEVDGLSGATITSNGVSSSLKYWFGSHGYKKLLDTVKAGGL